MDWNGNGTIDTLANGEIDMSVAVDYHGVQTHDIAPGDVLGLTPFTLAPGDTVSMVVAIVAASTLEELQKVADQAKMIYDNHFILPSAPEHPKVTVVPGDRKVYISWENNAELSKDKYREQDFEGYRV
ncbi:MAG: hypothetical protein B1H40_04320 [Candidatus Latescibacteria bacterium 4484_181]|nr:MAG: hypothetical protein B1H40_04320 [Candidatus Latescibacteria bacterium 4484_181]